MISRVGLQSAGAAESAAPRPAVLARLAIARDTAVLALAVSLFLALSVQNIALPGLYYDEALDVVPSMQILQGTSLEAVRGSGLTLGGRTFPLMVMDYVGTVNTYLALPLFALGGVNVTTVRLLPILLAALALALAYLAAYRLFDWRVAALTALLAAADPSYVLFSRMGIHVTSVMAVFALGSLLAFLRWHDSGHKARWLLLAGLLLGLGLWAKVLFLWWPVALAGGWLAMAAVTPLPSPPLKGEGMPNTLSLRERVGMRGIRERGATPRNAAVLLCGLLLGAAPLILYNVQTGGTLAALGRNALQTEHGVSNLAIGRNLPAAVDSFRVLLDGSYFWFMGGQFANRLAAPAFVLAVLVAAALLLYRRRAGTAERRRAAFVFVLVVMAVTVFESAFTVSGIWATHLYILLPLPQMVVALALVLLGETLLPRRAAGQAALLALGLTVLLAGQYQTMNSYYSAVQRSGGLSRFSNATYKLAGWLDSQRITAPVAVDWGIQKNVQIVTEGRVNPVEISGFPGEAPQAFVGRAQRALADPAAIFIFHSKEDTVYPLYESFMAVANTMGVKLKITDAFRDESGAPVYVIWRRE